MIPRHREPSRSTRCHGSRSACSRTPTRAGQDAGADLWDFALEIDTLFQAGLTTSDLRWLVARGFVEHGQELSVYGDPHRTFRRGDGFFFQHPTCVILTPIGAAFLGHLLREPVEFPPSVRPIETMPRIAGATAGPDHRPAATTDPECTIHRPGKPFWDGAGASYAWTVRSSSGSGCLREIRR